MGLSILSNIPSLEAQNQLSITNMNLQNTLFQLSSGSKINSGADDPAGLSIADGLQANISALTQSAQNVTDGVGMLQTADGALSQVTTLLNRAVTLATEAGNAGLTTDQQNALQNEYASITAEINQIGSNTTYNNNQVFTSHLTSVFLSDGSQTDAADPSISVTIPTLSATSLGLSSYATGTLDLTQNPQAGNTVQIGQQVYTFVNSGFANAAGDVALGTNQQGTLQNLQDAVNGTGNASPGTYGVGTATNQSAQITSVNGGSATVQSLAAGAAGNNVAIIADLTSNAGTSGATLTGGTNQTFNNATLALNAGPGTVGTAAGSVSMAALPDTIQSAAGTLNLAPLVSGSPTPALPTTGNATGWVNAGTTVAGLNGNIVNINGTAFTFETGALAAVNQVKAVTDMNTSLTNLMNAVNGTGASGANTYFAGTTKATGAVVSGFNTTTGQVNIAATSLTNGNNVTLATTGGTISGANLTGQGTSDTVTIGSQTYTFVAANAAVAGNEVAIVNQSTNTTAQNVTATLLNLEAAVNGGGTGGTGATFSSAATAAGTAQMQVAANATSATITATTAGTGTSGASSGNYTVLTATGTISGAVAPSGTLSGGRNADTVTIGAQTYTFVGAGLATAANDVAEGNSGNMTADILTTLKNLAGAVNGSYTGLTAGTTTWGAASTAAGTATISTINNGTATVTATSVGAGTSAAGTGNWVNVSATSPMSLISATAMSGGSNADTVTLGNVTYTFVAAGTQMTSGNQVAVGTASGTMGQAGYVSVAQATLNNLMAAVNAQTASTGTQTNFFVTNLQGASGATIVSDANGVAQVQALSSADIGLKAVFGGGNATGELNGLTTATLAGGAAAAGNAAAVAANGMIDLEGGQPAIGNATSTLTATANIAAGDTILVNNQTYTFTAASSATNNTVILGSNLQQSLQNLQYVVNGVGGTAGVNFGTGTNTAATGEVLSSFTTSGNTGTATFAATAIGTGGNGLALTYTNSGAANITSSGASAGGAASPDFVTIGAYNYTFVAANAAVANNEVALGVASGTAGTPTYVSAVQATLNNLMAAVNSTNVNNGAAATYHLTAGNLQNAGTGASITSVNGAQAVVTSNLAGVGDGLTTGNSTALSYTSNAATTNFAGSAAAGVAAGASGGTFQLASNPLNGNSVTIGNQTYTFVSSAPTAAYQVYIGATPNGTLNNLLQAVDNGTVAGANNGIGAGNTYGTGTVANASAQITGVNGNTATLASVGTGTAQNSIALNASISNGAAGGAVPTPTMLTGGSDATNAKATGILNLASNPVNNSTVTIGSTTYTFVTGTPTGADQVAIGAASGNTTAVEASLNNLMAAVNNGPTGTGAGTAYTSGTAANTQATITGVSGNQATVQAASGGSSGNDIVLLVGNGQTLGGGGGNVDLSSSTDAQNALTVIAGAISTVASTRGAIGSSINQMNAAVQVMNNTSQNLTSSLSGIQDADIGKVVANMSKYQVLEQTGIAALAQANQNEQVVLKLIP